MSKYNLKEYAEYFKQFGFNTTCITGKRNIINLIDKNLLKAPNHTWTHLVNDAQKENEFLSYSWQESIGLGVVLGYDGLFALDIDGCVEYDLVKAILKLLGLPANYEWVVRSGSGAGYHVIMYCNNISVDKKAIEEEIAKSRWEYIDDFGCAEVDAFYPKKMLKKVVYEEPFEKLVDSYFVLKSEVIEEIQKLNYESFFVDELFRKIEFRWKGHLVLPPSLHQSGKEYEFVNSMPEGKPYDVDYDKIKTVYEKVCSQKAHWSGGDNTRANIAKADSRKFKESFEVEPKYLIFDTETNGLPYDYKLKASIGDNWPKLVQLAWSICDQFGNQIKRESFLVKPEGFEISSKSFEIHGISNEIAEIAGISLSKILNLFISDLQQVKCIVAHNYEFDFNVLASEMMRIGLEASVLLEKEKICTMQKTVDYCGLKNSYGKKLPSLLELYEKLFGKIVQVEHSAGYDIVLLEMCFLRLLKIKVLEPDYLYKL